MMSPRGRNPIGRRRAISAPSRSEEAAINPHANASATGIPQARRGQAGHRGADAAVGGAVGARAGGLIGHLWRGMSRSDMNDLGEALDEGEAALVVVGRDRLEEKLREELKRAARTYEEQIDADAAEMRKELDKAIDEVEA